LSNVKCPPSLILDHDHHTNCTLRGALNSPHSGRSRCCPGATAGIPRISPGPCSAAGGVIHRLLQEDTAAEYRNGTPTPEPT